MSYQSFCRCWFVVLRTGLLTFSILISPLAFGFEGRVTATLSHGNAAQTLLFSVGTNHLRVERGETDRPYPRNILDLNTGELTLLYPHNRSFVRLKPQLETFAPTPPHIPAMPAMPSGIRPQTIGQTNLPGAPGMAGMSAMAMMPPMPMEKAELAATDQQTNLLGYVCRKFELRQGGEVMEIWATDQLLPFQPYQPTQPHRFGPRMIEEQWGELLQAKKLFPLRAVLRFEPLATPEATTKPAPGPERMRFEVKAITSEKIKAEDSGKLFQPPTDYHELEPLPF